MEPVIRFRCPACDYGLRVPGRHAGKRCRCPGCKDPIRIPAGPAGGEAGASPTPGAPDAAAGVRASGKRSRGAGRGDLDRDW